MGGIVYLAWRAGVGVFSRKLYKKSPIFVKAIGRKIDFCWKIFANGVTNIKKDKTNNAIREGKKCMYKSNNVKSKRNQMFKLVQPNQIFN